MADYYILAGAVILFMALSVYMIRRSTGMKKLKFDFEKKQSNQVITGKLAETEDFIDRLGKSLRISNFHEVTLRTEELLRSGKKREAVHYIITNTPLENNAAERLVNLFEARLRKV